MAYLADALAALIGSMLGVSTVATFAESTAGVADGAKTGLASLVGWGWKSGRMEGSGKEAGMEGLKSVESY